MTVLVRSPAKAAALAPLGVRVVAGHLHDPAALEAAVAGQDIVYHAAGLIAGRDEAEFMAVNRDGTRNVLRAAERASVGRLILVSSMAAAGPAARGRPLRGHEPPRPVTAYGRSKLAGEALVTGGRVPWTIVRPPMVYGPRDVEVLKLFRLARLGIAPLVGDGTQELSVVHAADLADALVAAGTGAGTVGRTYYACHPEIFTGEAIVREIGSVMGKSPVLVRVPAAIGRGVLRVTGAAARLAGRTTILTLDKANELFQPAWTGDPGPLTQDTGWRAARDLRTGLEETHRWYRAAGWL